MRLPISYRSKRRLLWGLKHFWAAVLIRRRYLFFGTILGLIAAGCISATQSRVYSSQVVVDSGVITCEHGVPVTPESILPNPGDGFGVRYGCSQCQLMALPVGARLVRWADEIARSIGITKIELEARVEKVRRVWSGE